MKLAIGSTTLIHKTGAMMLSSQFCHAVCLSLLCAGMAQAQNWVEIAPASGTAPMPRRNAAAVYDSATHRMIVFGGRTDAGDRNDVWAFDLNSKRWADLTPASGPSPAPRFTANGVYDPVHRHVIIWSGQGATFFNDVWAFDLHTNTWFEFNPPAPRPNVRYGTAAVFDPVLRDLVTFAGFTDQGRFEDTWRFDVDQARWREVATASAHPPKRCLHSASHDRLRHRMIIYGGQDNGALRDIWAFDLAQNSWSDLTPAHTPAGRWFPANIYDARQHRILIFGGNLGAAYTAEVWAFDLNNTTWQQLAPAGAAPAPREGAAAVYIESEDRMLVFGGRGQTHYHEVWALENLSGTAVVGDRESAAPQSFRLLGNHPNPFNPGTVIAYELPQAAWVSIKIYDTKGRLIKTLLDQFRAAGRHELKWEGTNQAGKAVASGTYFYTMRSGGVSQTGKMQLQR